MNLEKDDVSLEMKDWCIHNLVQYMKKPVASNRNKEHAPASFCKESDDVRLLNPASNGNSLFAIFCSAAENLELQRECDLSTTERMRNKLVEHFLEKQSTDTRCIDMGQANSEAVTKSSHSK